jgi:hypothetical protein
MKIGPYNTIPGWMPINPPKEIREVWLSLANELIEASITADEIPGMMITEDQAYSRLDIWLQTMQTSMDPEEFETITIAIIDAYMQAATPGIDRAHDKPMDEEGRMWMQHLENTLNDVLTTGILNQGMAVIVMALMVTRRKLNLKVGEPFDMKVAR